MLEVYSNDITVNANSFIPFNNTSIKKGCTAELAGNSTINLNKCGIYMVSCGGSAAASTTIQLYKDGVPLSNAISTSSSPFFITLIQVAENNSNCCPCSSPTRLQVMNTTEATFTNIDLVVTKLV